MLQSLKFHTSFLLVWMVCLSLLSVCSYSQTPTTWTGLLNNDFTDPGNWTNGIPNGVGVHAILDGTSSNPGGSICHPVNSECLLGFGICGRLTIGPGDGVTVFNDWQDFVTLDVIRNDTFPMSGLIENDGLISIGNGGSFGAEAALQIEGEVELVGSGSVSLSTAGGGSTNISSPHARIMPSGLAHLTNRSTIRGSGVVSVDFTNASEGLLASETGTLSVLSGTNPVLNQGTMRATSGTLNFPNTEIDNTGGTIDALNGTVRFELATISGGTLTTTGNGEILTSGGASTVSDLSILGEIHVPQGGKLELNGVIDNQGLIRPSGSGGGTGEINVDTAATLTGGGTISGAPSQTFIRDFNGTDGVLTNHDNRIAGLGNFGLGTIELVNQADGVIDANVAGQTLTLFTNSNGITNQGTLQSSDGGSLHIGNGSSFVPINNSGGTIIAMENSITRLTTGCEITDGTLSTEGDGEITIGSAELINVANLGYATVFGRNFATAGTIDNQGQIEMLSGSFFNVDLATTLSGGGAISGVLFFRDMAGGQDGILTNENNLIEGRGQLGLFSLQIVNEKGGVIHANVDGNTLFLQPRSGDPMINRGLIRASNGGLLSIQGSTIDNTGGVIRIEDGSNMSASSSPTIIGGVIETIGTGEVELFGIVSMSDLTLDGKISLFSADLDGTIQNLDHINIGTTSSFGSVTCDSAVGITGPGSMDLLNSNSRIVGNGSLSMMQGTLRGIGFLDLDCQFQDGAMIAPGNSIGGLDLRGDHSYQFVNGARIEIEMNATNGTPGVNWDFLNAGINLGSGTIDFDDEILPPGVTIELVSLDTAGEAGPLDTFDPNTDFSIAIAEADLIVGFDAANFFVDRSQFQNDTSGHFYVSIDNNQLILNYAYALLGDTNGDGSINLLDVAPFINAIGGGSFVAEADINQDGAVNLLDVAGFVDLLAG